MANTFPLERLSFHEGHVTYILHRFLPEKMIVQCTKIDLTSIPQSIELPFAHLPKKIKKIINPLTR